MSKKYTEYKNLNFAEISFRILAFWDNNKIFEKSISNRSKAQEFRFYEGPPGANGAPGIHHVLSRVIKDTFCRYKTLKGFKVERKAGWDTHGLPVELQVEKQLNITKDDIGSKISIKDYNAECKKTVMAFKSQWDDLTKKMGYWTDLDNPYITYDNQYIESVWYLLKQLYDKDLIYKGYSIQPYSPAAGTGLSTHELNMPGCYKDVKDTSIVVQFKVLPIQEEVLNTNNFIDENLSETDNEVFHNKMGNAPDNDFFLAWTTTPWTLPANSALAVNTNINYVKVATFNRYTHEKINVILAEKAIERYFQSQNEVTPDEELHLDTEVKTKSLPWKKMETLRGEQLINMRYEQLMPYVQPKDKNNAFKVIAGDFVSTEDGTGIVHIAPTFGADDMRVAQKNNIESILITNKKGETRPIVNLQGTFVDEITDFAGKFVKESYDNKIDDNTKKESQSVDVLIAIKLKKENKAFLVEKYEHSYPHCWRTDKPILYYPLNSWFIKTTQYKDRLVELNKTINWVPDSVGKGRFGNWLENLVDWNLSRDRYWGIPLPIWRTKDGKETKCIGSLEELERELTKADKLKAKSIDYDDFLKAIRDGDLHRPFVDDIILYSDTGQKMYREEAVIDVWFDSGAMPYAQDHYPFSGKKLDDIFPADLIAEGVDQTRGWFFTLHTIATMLFDSVAFKNVVVNGLVLDKDGNKMSKSLGNTIKPIELIDKHGIDVIRWYMVASSNPWENLKFDVEELVKVRRKLFNTLENVYNFFAIYANIDNFQYTSDDNDSDSDNTEIDTWIISKLNSLIYNVDLHYNNYDVTKAARAIQEFVVDDLSNWYVRLNRKRFWSDERSTDNEANLHKNAAYNTLYRCLINISKLCAPIIPFYSEKLYLDILTDDSPTTIESVHLSDFPVFKKNEINTHLEKKMKVAQTITSLVHSLRKKHKIKVRQPLFKILVPVTDEEQKNIIEEVKDIILQETNIKNIQYLEKDQNIIKREIKPNFQRLGRKYGKKMNAIAQKLKSCSQEDIRTIEKQKFINPTIDNEEIKITIDDVSIFFKDIEGYVIANDTITDGFTSTEYSITVALDTTLNEDLISEGLARGFINKIQNLRKDLNFDVQDRISVVTYADNQIQTAINAHKERICSEVLATSLNFTKEIEQDSKEIEIDKYKIFIKIIKK